MKLPELNKPEKYVGLYVIDFGDNCAVGYTAPEVAAILESEKFASAKVYKIHRATPDGSLELNGISNQRFTLESAMIFQCPTETIAKNDYAQLKDIASVNNTPCMAKVQLAEIDGQYFIAAIYPAEYENEIGQWFADSGFKGHGSVDAGVSQLESFYQMKCNMIESIQLIPAGQEVRDFATLLAAVGDAVQR
ncbi:MAG: hypothetical protein JEZ07_11980 [Phycisphaerae bacterium]|nr:hypothetical protein [Phycisphaerae bacterium]